MSLLGEPRPLHREADLVAMSVGKHVFRIALRGSPRCVREIEVDSLSTLYALARGIVGAFDFSFDHCFGFYPPGKRVALDAMPRYELFNDIGEDTGGFGVERVKVTDVFAAARQ